MGQARAQASCASGALAAMIGIGLLVTTNQAMADSGLYLGLGYGASRVNNSDFDDDDTAKKVFVGAKFNDYFGLEAAANDYGGTADEGYSSELKGNTLALVGFLPVTDRFDFFVKGGKLWWRDKISVLDTYRDTLDGDENFYGAGVNFNFGESVSLRLEMERYKVELSQDEIGVDLDEKYDVDVAGVGIAVNF
jgi:OmpA-OmpF porin, OOP family